MVQDMRSFYMSCNLLVLPSRSEGSPNVVLEAMAMKLPVVASDSGPRAKWSPHMRDGFLFPVGDVDKLTETVELALSASDLRAAFAARALRKTQGPLSARQRRRARTAVWKCWTARRTARRRRPVAASGRAKEPHDDMTQPITIGELPSHRRGRGAGDAPRGRDGGGSARRVRGQGDRQGGPLAPVAARVRPRCAISEDVQRGRGRSEPAASGIEGDGPAVRAAAARGLMPRLQALNP